MLYNIKEKITKKFKLIKKSKMKKKNLTDQKVIRKLFPKGLKDSFNNLL